MDFFPSLLLCDAVPVSLPLISSSRLPILCYATSSSSLFISSRLDTRRHLCAAMLSYGCIFLTYQLIPRFSSYSRIICHFFDHHCDRSAVLWVSHFQFNFIIRQLPLSNLPTLLLLLSLRHGLSTLNHPLVTINVGRIYPRTWLPLGYAICHLCLTERISL